MHGLPIGGCLSVNIACIILNQLLDKTFKIINIKPILCNKYINYLIQIIDGNQIEKNNKINYLYLRIQSVNNKLSLSDIGILLQLLHC